MTTATSQARGAVVVESVDFAVPGGGTIGPRFASWQEAVEHARERNHAAGIPRSAGQ